MSSTGIARNGSKNDSGNEQEKRTVKTTENDDGKWRKRMEEKVREDEEER